MITATSFILNLSDSSFRSQSTIQKEINFMTDFEKPKSKKPSGRGKLEEEKPRFEISTKTILNKNKKEKDYIGSYCKETFRRYKVWKSKLSSDEQNENENGLFIEKPKETLKIFNSIELFDVFGCVKHNRPYYPKSYLVISKDKEEQKLTVIPWQSTWLEAEHTKDSITQYAKEYYHQFKNTNLDNSISIEDISLSISLNRLVKLYKLDKITRRFSVSDEEARKIRIVQCIRTDLANLPEIIA